MLILDGQPAVRIVHIDDVLPGPAVTFRTTINNNFKNISDMLEGLIVSADFGPNAEYSSAVPIGGIWLYKNDTLNNGFTDAQKKAYDNFGKIVTS